MAQSPELAGGLGFAFEHQVSAYYLVALLAETYAAGSTNRLVCKVSLQQCDFGEPLDDLVVDFRDASGDSRLSLQVKRSLVISDASSNADFRQIVADCWATLNKSNFRLGCDGYGAAVGDIAKDKARDLMSLCTFARESITVEHFGVRFSSTGNASAAVSSIKNDIANILAETIGRAPTPEELKTFLSHLTLVEFDFLQGQKDTTNVMDRLRSSLALSDIDRAPLLWSELCQLAQSSAGRSGQFDRGQLLSKMSNGLRFRGAPSLRDDLAKINAISLTSASDIQDDVSGCKLDRGELSARLEEAISESRFVHVSGLPGTGKSVLLRQRVEADLKNGPVLLLKSERLDGCGWAGYAHANGISNVPLQALLVEIGATGSATLYIDGIDRIEKEHRAIILDVLRAIFASPLLEKWKVVASLRDTGIEQVRSWMGNLFDRFSAKSISVDVLSDLEAEALATNQPQLRPFLFGPIQVQEIVRRPFFAKILSQNFVSGVSSAPFMPGSEIDLIQNWWTKGGYDTSGQNAIERQRAIIEIAGIRARNLSKPISLSALSTVAIGRFSELVQDGILQNIKVGHTFRFAHDIFFEWSFFHVLDDCGESWLDEIARCGEPPAVARVVELLSAFQHFTSEKDWLASLDATNSHKMRSQWMRAWLLGPLSNPAFRAESSAFTRAVTNNEFRLLKKALVWFQADKTIPNPNILAADIPPESRARLAHMVGWPSDLSAWGRFILFLLARTAVVPSTLYPDILAVFEVWQNLFANSRNAVSGLILKQCSDWLREIDQRAEDVDLAKTSKLSGVPGFRDFRQSLSRILLRAAHASPDVTSEYLNRLIGSSRLRRDTFEEVIEFSPTLAVALPNLLVELTLSYMKEELPDEQVARERREAAAAARARQAVLAKPKEERTRNEELFVSGMFTRFGNDFSYHDWETLSLAADTSNYFPASPLREPFKSLFESAPDYALKLITELCNHAMLAWRQLHRHIHDSPGTPLPLRITFPWGVQEFWGTDREYLWYRGLWGPKPLACGFLALEQWCFTELDRDQNVDDLIRKIVQGNECIAILGVAVTLALHTQTVSETIFPLIATQKLWSADAHRMAQDMGHANAGLIGFRGPADLPHAKAVQFSSERPVRKTHLRWFAPVYVLDSSFGERTRAAIVNFANDPPFEFVEHQNLPGVREGLARQAAEDAELAELSNYRAQRVPDDPQKIAITHTSPTASKPENVEKVERARHSLQVGNLWALNVKSLETGKLADGFNLSSAVDFAKSLYSESLFSGDDRGEDLAMCQGSVAATAASVLTFRAESDPRELSWAREILARAMDAPEKRDDLWTPMAIIPWHPSLFVARGLAADLRAGFKSELGASNLLTLVSHPLECVSLVALEQALSLWGIDSKLAWAALFLSLKLCVIHPRKDRAPRQYREDLHEPSVIEAAVSDALNYYRNGEAWHPLPTLPPAWVQVDASIAKPGRRAMRGRTASNNTDQVWEEPSVRWYSQYAAKILSRIPVAKIMASDARNPLLAYLSAALAWTREKIAPPWKDEDRNRDHSRHLEWVHAVGSLMGTVSGTLDWEDYSILLQPILDLNDEPCFSLLASCVETYICAYIYDAPVMPNNALPFLGACLTRVLRAPAFDPHYYHAGELSGFDQGNLVRSLMFVSVERADMATRYVNGDWADIHFILPIVDRFVKHAGWAATVMNQFLLLCERARSAYPAAKFADQILAVIGSGQVPLKGWHGTVLPGRIADLVQHLAERDAPMSPDVAQQLLRVLDLLVDMGDRCSAALQLTENFREVRRS